MNTETLEFPPIEEPSILRAEVPSGAFAITTLRTSTLSALSTVDAGIAQLKAEHGSTSYDITTPTGYKLATLRRHAIRQVRYQVPKIVKERKAELKGLIGELESEAERITESLLAIERPHDELIAAEDARREAERAAKAAAEEARRQGHRDRIHTIRSYLERCQGLPSARIANGIVALQAVAVAGLEEFEAEAQQAKDETLVAMRELKETAEQRETDDAQREAQRIENERVAAENARIAAELAERERAQKAEAQRLADLAAKMEQERAAELARLQAEREEQRLAAERSAQQAAEQAARSAAPVDPDTGEVLTQTRGASETDRIPGSLSQDAAAHGTVVELVTLDQLNQCLGLGASCLTRALLAGFGINGTPGPKAGAVLYAASDWPLICDALIAHINARKVKTC